MYTFFNQFYKVSLLYNTCSHGYSKSFFEENSIRKKLFYLFVIH